MRTLDVTLNDPSVDSDSAFSSGTAEKLDKFLQDRSLQDRFLQVIDGASIITSYLNSRDTPVNGRVDNMSEPNSEQYRIY